MTNAETPVDPTRPGQVAPVLSIRDLDIDFWVDGTWYPAVEQAGFDLFPGEVLAIVGESVAGFEQVDRILREQVRFETGSGAAGFKLGPFELMDLTGLDVSHPVMESIYRQFYDEPRFRPSAIAAQRAAGGLLGRKTGRGFRDHSAR